MIVLYTLTLLLASAATTAGAASGLDKAMPGPAAARVERVIDGDTVKMRVAVWIDQEIIVSVRVAGVDAPELFRPKCPAEKTMAIKARVFVEDFLSSGEAVLRDIDHGKYAGRVVARIENENGDLGSALVASGFAVKGGKGNWCNGV